MELTLHARTNLEVIAQFLDVDVRVYPEARSAWMIEVG
jgi:RNA 3'-terminal phosphate cyclase